jgi:hypothetical protein
MHASRATLPVYIHQNYPLAVEATKLLIVKNYHYSIH